MSSSENLDVAERHFEKYNPDDRNPDLFQWTEGANKQFVAQKNGEQAEMQLAGAGILYPFYVGAILSGAAEGAAHRAFSPRGGDRNLPGIPCERVVIAPPSWGCPNAVWGAHPSRPGKHR
jgi:hypothetical protein